MKKVVISASGGMDSTALILHFLKHNYEVYAYSFNYGQRHIIELNRLQKNIEYFSSKGYPIKHKTLDLSALFSTKSSVLTDSSTPMPEGYYEEESMKQTVVPNRNAIFASIIFGKALSISKEFDQDVAISMGVHSGDHAIYPDCRPKFHKKLFEAFCVGNWASEKLSLILPYICENKYTILKEALSNCAVLELDFDTVFRNTNTSYEPDEQGRSSGKTGADVERILAFHALGRKDPVPYQQNWKSVLSWAKNKEKEYQKKKNRTNSTKVTTKLTFQEWFLEQDTSFSPLFDVDKNNVVSTMTKRSKKLIKRHPFMEQAMIKQVKEGLKRKDWQGYIYVMCHGSEDAIEPLYIGISSKKGKKRDINSNIANIETDRQRFGRWGDGGAYHIGDLSQAIFNFKVYKKVSKSKESWASVLFSSYKPLHLFRPVSLAIIPWYESSLTPSGHRATLRDVEKELIALATIETNGRLLNIVDVPWWETGSDKRGEKKYYSPQQKIDFIDRLEALKECKDEIARAPVIALDVETKMYEKTLCLVQISTPQRNYVIDMIRIPIDEASIILQELFTQKQPIIIHNASFEKRILGQHNIELSNVVDTLKISRDKHGKITGGHSLQAVCERELGLSIDKKEQCSDWDTRPLTQNQIRYAAVDAEVLLLLNARFQNINPQQSLFR